MRKRLIKFISVSLILLLSFSIASISVYASSKKPVLKKGMSSSAVKTLQINLKKLGFLSANPTGYYGDATVSAVKRFQKKYSIPSTGMVASLTYNKLEAVLKPAITKKAPVISTQSRDKQKPNGLKMGSTNQEVLKLQKDLTLLGYMKVSPTGNFGSVTEGALIQFQKYYGLDPSGVADTSTLSVIERLLSQTAPVSRGDVDRGNANQGETDQQSSNIQVAYEPLYKVNLQWIPGLPQAPFLKGVGKYEGVVIHYTDNVNDTAQIEANHEKVHWSRAFVHEFIDPKEIIQVADPEYKSWGAGEHANDRFIHLELCHADNQSDFNASFSMITQRAAEYLYRRQLGVSPAKADGTGTLWGHMDVTNYLGGTDHVDPIAYLAKWGITWNDVISTVTEKYNALVSGVNTNPKEATAENTTVEDKVDNASDNTAENAAVTTSALTHRL